MLSVYIVLLPVRVSSGRLHSSRIEGSATACLKTSYAHACFLYLSSKCHAVCLYSSSTCSSCVYPRSSPTCLIIELTAFAFANFSVHRSTSSFETLLLDKSIYPFSLSTLMTTTGSVFPTRISLFMERIRLLDNSESRIMPSILLYSKMDIGSHFCYTSN